MSKYLDKYLEKKPQKDKSSKKLKSIKPKKFMGAGLRIVDSDISSIPTRNGTTKAEHGPGAGVDEIFNDQLVDADELPQIANFIDERPHEIKLLEEFRQADKWKTVTTTAPSRVGNNSDSDSSLPRSSVAKSKVHSSKNSKSIRSRQRDSDESPPRHQDRHRNAKRNNSDSDISPPRHKKNSKSDRQSHQKSHTRASDSDPSPPRSRRDKSPNSDVSPPRHSYKKTSNPDPSRSSYSQISSGKKDKRSRDVNNSKSQNYSDSDNSPPRSRHRRNSSNSFSPTRGRSSTQKTKTSSHPRHQQRQNSSDSDMSPPRHDQQQRGYRNAHSISQGSRNRQASVSPPPTHNTNKQTKTLDGKKAGLQTAGALKGELEHIKRLEANRFNEMDDEISGRYAKTKVRDRQTGKERDFQAELEKKMEDDEKANKRKAQYDKWGKGLKQVQEQEERVSSAIHEMSKPLARYKDDEDLDEHLKNQDRDGDPMLAFLTKKKKKTDSGPAKPLYQGPPPPPNRFGILPGYRWDGVDRSSGYEKEWFGRINARKALQDESYKWSVEDL